MNSEGINNLEDGFTPDFFSRTSSTVDFGSINKY